MCIPVIPDKTFMLRYRIFDTDSKSARTRLTPYTG